MIGKIATNSKVTETNGTANEILNVSEEFKIEDPFLNGVTNKLGTKNAILQDAIKYSKAVSDLADGDGDRDMSLISFNHLLLAFNNHPIEEIKVATNTVKNVFDKYTTSITKESYIVQSSLANSLINDLQKQEIMEAMNKIPTCTDLFNRIVQTQRDFEKSLTNYEILSSKDKEVISAYKLKAEVIQIINEELVVYLNGIVLSQPEKYSNLCAAIEKAINRNNKAVKNRKNNNGNVSE